MDVISIVPFRNHPFLVPIRTARRLCQALTRPGGPQSAGETKPWGRQPSAQHQGNESSGPDEGHTEGAWQPQHKKVPERSDGHGSDKQASGAYNST